MTLVTLFFLASFAFALWFTVTKVGARPSITLLLLGGLLLIHGLPLLVYQHVTGPETLIYEAALAPLDPDEVFTRLLLAMGLTYLGVVAGVAGVRAVHALSHAEAGTAAPAPDWDGPVRQVYRLGPGHQTALWALAVLMLGVIVTEGQPAKIANYFLAAASELDQLMLRVEGGGTPYYLYNVFLYSVAPFVVMVVWCASRFDPQDGGLRRLLLTLIGLVLLGKLGTLSKAPPVIFVLQLALLAAILASQRIRPRDIVSLVVLVVGLFALVVSLTFPDLDLEGVFQFLYYRGLDIPNEGLLEYFAAFPSAFPHNWEFGFFGYQHRPVGLDVLPNYYAVAELHRGSILSTSNVMFVGDAWADWGWAGVVAFPVAAGALVQAVDLYAGRYGRTDEWACVTAASSFSIFTMLTTALPTALVTGGLLLIPIASWLLTRGLDGAVPDRAQAH